MKKRGADWLAWTMQAIFGALVGAATSFFFIGRTRSFLRTDDEILMAVVAGIGSRFGDAFWMANSFSLVGSDEPRSSVLSRTVSWTMTTVGVGLFGWFLYPGSL